MRITAMTAAALSLVPASLAAEVDLVLVAEITEKTVFAGNADARLAPPTDVGDLVLLSFTYDDATAPIAGPLGTSYTATSAGMTIGTWGSSHVLPFEDGFAGITIDDRSSADVIVLVGGRTDNLVQVILIDDSGQALADEMLHPCLEVDRFETESGSFELYTDFDGGAIFSDFDFDIVGQLSGYCDGFDRPFAVADWRPAQTSVGGDTVRVELDASESLGDTTFFFWRPLSPGSPMPTDDNTPDAIVDLLPGTHIYEVVVATAAGYDAKAQVEIVIGEGPEQCPADVNNDGLATPADFTAWLAAFNVGCP